MWEALQRYNALSPDARKMFRRAAILLPLLGASLRISGYKKTQQRLQEKIARAEAAAPVYDEVVREKVEITCRMVRAAGHYSPLPSSCLDQSLLLWYLLQRQGIAASMRIGVRKDAKKFEAHAWVEHNGVALNQAGDQHRHYAPFESELSKPPAEWP